MPMRCALRQSGLATAQLLRRVCYSITVASIADQPLSVFIGLNSRNERVTLCFLHLTEMQKKAFAVCCLAINKTISAQRDPHS
jgi:hypothetical protein